MHSTRAPLGGHIKAGHVCVLRQGQRRRRVPLTYTVRYRMNHLSDGRSLSQFVARNVVALIAISALWIGLQFAFNALFLFVGAVRGDGPRWSLFLQNAVSPGTAAYVSFSIVAHFMRNGSWKFLVAAFFLMLVSYTVWGISFNAEHYLLAQRVAEWREVFWGSVASAAAATVGAIIFAMQQRSNQQ